MLARLRASQHSFAHDAAHASGNEQPQAIDGNERIYDYSRSRDAFLGPYATKSIRIDLSSDKVPNDGYERHINQVVNKHADFAAEPLAA
jgi:hypothetical protein